MATLKPMLASDYEEEKLRFPLLVQPKVDGVRALNLAGKLTGRSLKAHKNRHVTDLFSGPKYQGLDGELVLVGYEHHPDACRLTSSAVGTIEGQPSVEWWVFDYITQENSAMSYEVRYEQLRTLLHFLGDPRVKLMPSWRVENLGQVEQADEYFLAKGFEGTILRDPFGKYKSGRSTAREGGLLRIKRFVEEDGIVVSLTEGESNGNEAKTNELGQTERSSHQANMTPNGMVGTLEVRLIKDVAMGKVTLKSGTMVTVSAGSMPHEDRLHFFRNQSEILGKTIKFKFFPKGVKDKPRFPTFQCIRNENDA
jgi:DNA ligase-1